MKQKLIIIAILGFIIGLFIGYGNAQLHQLGNNPVLYIYNTNKPQLYVIEWGDSKLNER